jgi:F0F1-type ATP synthase membrane subunit b/b'
MTNEQIEEIIHKLEVELNSLKVAAEANDEDSFRCCLDDLYCMAQELACTYSA